MKLPDGVPTARNAALDGLRGMVILLVLVTHWGLVWQPRLAPDSPWTAIATAAFAIGNSGVDLFFLLSGYLIYETYLARQAAFRTFIARRAWRIYPAFLAMFAVYLALSARWPAAGKIPEGTAAAIGYLARCLLFLPGILDEAPLIGTAWSLSYEWAFYLALPALVGAFGLRRAAPGKRVLAIAAAAAGLAAVSCATGRYERMLMFPAGMLVRELALRPPGFVRWRGFDLAAAMAAVAAVAADRSGSCSRTPDGGCRC